MKIAVIHDWLTVYAGAEKALKQILVCFPSADLFTMVDFLPSGDREFLLNRKITTSFIQRLPFAKKFYRNYLPLMPFAVEQFDLSAYDLILSSSHAVAKGVITSPDQLHVSYVHSPMRYAWDLQHQYLSESGNLRGLKSVLIRIMLHKLRIWDLASSYRVDLFLTNSSFIGRRINKIYRRTAEVIFGPVALDDFSLETKKDDYYLTASRLVPYKKVELIASAFNAMPDKKLIIIGDGPDRHKIERVTKNAPNIEYLGYQSFESLIIFMKKAKAFIFAAEEDLGLTPIEAQACGTPVIAYGKGGVTDTVIPFKTGLFFHEQTAESIKDAVVEFENLNFDSNQVRLHAEKFSEGAFRERLVNAIELELSKRNLKSGQL